MTQAYFIFLVIKVRSRNSSLVFHGRLLSLSRNVSCRSISYLCGSCCWQKFHLYVFLGGVHV